MQSSSHITDFQNTLEQLKTLSLDRILQQPLQTTKDQKEAESVHAFVSSAVIFAKAVKKGEDDAGLTLKDWNVLPKAMTENKEFIKSVLINKDIVLNKALQKQLLQLYWKDQAK